MRIKYFEKATVIFLPFTLLIALLLPLTILAQKAVVVNDNISQHIFSYSEIEQLEDKTSKHTIEQVSSASFNHLFEPSSTSTPHTENLSSTYWYRIKISHNTTSQKRYILEFFDQTIDEITAYIPTAPGRYNVLKIGDRYPFSQRLFHHKNFEIPLENNADTTKTYYFRLKSSQADIIIVLRSVDWFIHYALDEYFSFGIFYGMILVFSLYNLLMFFAIRQRQYLDFVVYVLSVGFYQMSADGIAYQYLWPDSPQWNQYAYGIALYFVSITSLLFTRDLLYVKEKAPLFYKLINSLIILRSIIFLATVLFNNEWFNYKFIEFVPLIVSFLTGIHIFRKGYRPARFFVLGYGFLFLGFTIKLLILLTHGRLNFGVLSYYSLSICFILEMILLSFAIGDRVRVLKLKKDKAQKRIIQQMKENERLKNYLNKELESQVEQRTKEVIEKSEIIESQNAELTEANILLEQQTKEISRMNILLAQDNFELQTNIEKVSKARVMSAEVNFEEFSKIYPDADSCYKFLADLKWDKGYSCSKCRNERYFQGHQPYSRRCSKCSYEESVTANTIFHNTRITINKAFYITFLIYFTKGKISSHKLSEILSLRQSTCWAYGNKIKRIMEARKKELRHAGEQGWSKLVLE